MEHKTLAHKTLEGLVILLHRTEEGYLIIKDSARTEPFYHFPGFVLTSESGQEQIDEKIKKYFVETLMCDASFKLIDIMGKDAKKIPKMNNKSDKLVPEETQIRRQVFLYLVDTTDSIVGVSFEYKSLFELSAEKNKMISSITSTMAPYVALYERLKFAPVEKWPEREQIILNYLKQGCVLQDAEKNSWDDIFKKMTADTKETEKYLSEIGDKINTVNVKPKSLKSIEQILPDVQPKQKPQIKEQKHPETCVEYLNLFEEVSNHIDELISAMSEDPNFGTKINSDGFKQKYQTLSNYNARLRSPPTDKQSQEKFDSLLNQIIADRFWPPKQEIQQAPYAEVKSLPSIDEIKHEEIPEQLKQQHMMISVAIGSAKRTAKLNRDNEGYDNLDRINQMYLSNQGTIQLRIQAATEMLIAIGIDYKQEYEKVFSKKK